MQIVESLRQVFEAFLDTLQPLTSFFSTHPTAHLSLIIATLLLLIVLLFVNRKNNSVKTTHFPQEKSTPINPDIQAIAGDDVFATQLDLAKAYIEMNQNKLAKQMLDNVMKDGNYSQKNTARQLTRSL